MGQKIGPVAAIGTSMLAGCRTGGVIDPDFGEHSAAHDSKTQVSMSAPSGQGPFTAVTLMHGCNGLDRGTERGMALHAGHLNGAGFVTQVVDSCTSNRKAARPPSSAGTTPCMPIVDPRNVFLMGISHCGSVAARLAGDPSTSMVKGQEQDEDPAKPWFRALPWCPHPPKRLDTPLLVLSGAQDDWTPPLGCFWHTAAASVSRERMVAWFREHML